MPFGTALFLTYSGTVFCVLIQDSAKGLSMFTGEEEIFAFQRTISRLTEMQTEQYWKDGDRNKEQL